MAFCVFGDVRSIVETDMTDAEITTLITWVDARIKLKLSTASAPSGSGLSAAEWAAFLEGLSATWAAYRCMLKDPNAERLGEQQYDRAQALLQLEKEILDMLKSGGGGIAFQYHSESLPF
jgi:hypothetical protein